MTTEQKLRLLEVSQRIVQINKDLFELSAELTGEDLVPIVKTVDKLLQAGDAINKSISSVNKTII